MRLGAVSNDVAQGRVAFGPSRAGEPGKTRPAIVGSVDPSTVAEITYALSVILELDAEP